MCRENGKGTYWLMWLRNRVVVWQSSSLRFYCRFSQRKVTDWAITNVVAPSMSVVPVESIRTCTPAALERP